MATEYEMNKIIQLGQKHEDQTKEKIQLGKKHEDQMNKVIQLGEGTIT